MEEHLLKNRWEPAQAKAIASSQSIALPASATAQELDDMAYYYVELFTAVYNDLAIVAKWDYPIVEAGMLTKQLLENATR